MKRSFLTLTLAALLLVLAASAAHAGAKLQISDKASIDLGFRLQALYINTDRDIDGDGNFDSFEDFRIRRARFRLKGVINEHVEMFMQTDVSGNDVQLIDGYIVLKNDSWSQFFIGQHLVPSNRQNVTSSGALMALDRPNSIYKSLTWGLRVLSTFDTATLGDSDLGIRGTAQVRDVGVTLFGSGTAGGNSHLKYYLGYYDGISAPGTDSGRYTGRIQLNFGDAEGGYYNTSTYLGKKQTFGIGFSFDNQSDVGRNLTIGGVPVAFRTDYTYWSADLFSDQQLGSGWLTVEASYADLDLDGQAPRLEGDGGYIQFGYLFSSQKWQIWGLYDGWSSNDPTGRGGFDAWRAGISYFLAGHNANIKVGYESFTADVNIGSSNEDTIDSLVVGVYTTY